MLYIQTSSCSLTGSGSGQQGDDEGQAQAGDMSRYHRRPPQPHIQPEVPHPQPLSHRAVLHIRPHAAEPPAGLPAHSGPCERGAETEKRGACSSVTLRELHNHEATMSSRNHRADRRADRRDPVRLHEMTTHCTSGVSIFKIHVQKKHLIVPLLFYSGVVTVSPAKSNKRELFNSPSVVVQFLWACSSPALVYIPKSSTLHRPDVVQCAQCCIRFKRPVREKKTIHFQLFSWLVFGDLTKQVKRSL